MFQVIMPELLTTPITIGFDAYFLAFTALIGLVIFLVRKGDRLASLKIKFSLRHGIELKFEGDGTRPSDSGED